VGKTRTGTSHPGTASELDEIGHLGFHYGPDDEHGASGMDIARSRDGVIIELYKIITDIYLPQR
jgi:hypothetical protein